MSTDAHDINPKCIDCPVRMSGLCKYAGDDVVKELASVSITSTYPPGASIMNQGDLFNYLGLITSGTVVVTTVTQDGHRIIVDLLEESGIIGDTLETEARFNYEAASSVTLCLIPRKTFAQIASTHPGVAYGAWETTQKHGLALLEWLTLLNFGTSLQRLAAYLSALASQQGPGLSGAAMIGLEIPLSRRDLAAYLGTTPETLSRNFSQLEKMRILKTMGRRQLSILSIAGLHRVAAERGEELHSLSQHRPPRDVVRDGARDRASPLVRPALARPGPGR